MKKLISRFSRPDRKISTRRPLLRTEPLEQRQMLAVTANPDTYTIAEDAPLSTAAGVTQRSTWTRFEGITFANGASSDYPDANQASEWKDVNYNTSNPSFGTWQAPASAPFSTGGVTALTGTVTPLGAAYVNPATLVTALFRKNFTSSNNATSGSGKILCDDGCIVYVNGVEVFRDATLPAPTVANTPANAAHDENTFISFNFSGIPLTNDGNNVVAVELHQQATTSTDIGFDMELTVNGASALPNLRSNDTISAPTTAASTYYFDESADPITTTATTGNVYGTGSLYAGGPIQEFVVGTVTIDPATGNFAYAPKAVNYSGDATFTYVLRDNANATSFSSGNVTFHVTPVNDAPVGVADTYIVGQGTGFTIGVDGRPTQIISKGSLWHYLSDGSDQSANIKNPNFDPGTATPTPWPVGYAEFGYGDGDEKTVISCGPVAACNASNYITSYYGKQFKLATIPSELQLNIRRDDGAVVYINGIEVVRTGMPATGEITSTTLSPGTSSETEYFQYRIPTAGLNLSTVNPNRITVELHNVNTTSSDMSFDMEMYAPVTPAEYISEHSDWYYKDDGNDHSTEIRSDQTQFNPTTWVTHGPAELGFGDGDEQTVIRCDVGGSNAGGAPCANTANIITQYFARNFDLPGGTPSTLVLHVRRDDGAVIYINGHEVVRTAMPEGDITPSTLALDPVSETDFFTYVVPTAGLGLQATGNLITAEVHQITATSSDLSFALKMESGSIGLLANDSDVESVTSALTAVNLNQAGLTVNGVVLGSVSLNTNGTFTFTPTNGSSQGTGTFTYQVSDGTTTSAPVTVTITLRSTDLGPVVAVDDVFTTNEDTAFTPPLTVGTIGPGLLFNDTTAAGDEGDPVVVSIVAAPTAAQGTVVLDSTKPGIFTFTPAANFNGDATFTYKVNDGFHDSNTATVTIHVTPVDDRPVAVTDSYQVYENRALNASITALGSPYLPNNSTWDYLSPTTAQGYPVDGSNRVWYATNFDKGSSTVPGWASGAGAFVFDAITNVPKVTDLPGPNSDHLTDLFRTTFNLAAGTAAGITGMTAKILADDGAVFYVNGKEVQRLQMPAGQILISTTASANWDPEDYKTIQLAIPAGVLVDGQNTIAVELHNSATTSSDRGFDLGLYPVLGLMVNDTDLEGDAISNAQAASQPAHGSVTVNANGTFTYTPVAGYIGADSFTYTVQSNGLTSLPGTVNVTVVKSPVELVANNDVYTTPVDTTLNGNVVTNDVGDGPLTVVDANDFYISTGQGEFDWNESGANKSGAFTFFPEAGFTGTFLFDGSPTLTYTVKDAHGITKTATLSITVGGPTLPSGDFNNDTFINRADLRILLAHFGETSGVTTWDMDGDGHIGVKDAIKLRNNFTGSPSPAAAAVVATTRGAAVDSAIVRANESGSRLVARRRATEATSTLGGSTETSEGSTETSLRARRTISASAVDSVLSRSRR